jgi:hypothetical protein
MNSARSLYAATVVVVVGIYQLQVAAQPTTIPVMADRLQTMLIRNTLTAVNHGIITGNFTVLRDLATDNFRHENQAGDLAAMFAPLRQQKLDLSPTLITDPQLTRVDSSPDILKLTGVFPTRPRQVEFTLGYKRVERGWMIDEIAIHVAP